MDHMKYFTLVTAAACKPESTSDRVVGYFLSESEIEDIPQLDLYYIMIGENLFRSLEVYFYRVIGLMGIKNRSVLLNAVDDLINLETCMARTDRLNITSEDQFIFTKIDYERIRDNTWFTKGYRAIQGSKHYNVSHYPDGILLHTTESHVFTIEELVRSLISREYTEDQVQELLDKYEKREECILTYNTENSNGEFRLIFEYDDSKYK
jgi:hypothetical protein